MGACVVEVNGNDYYVPCDRVDYIYEIDGYLINTGSSSITLYSSFPDPNVQGSGYPRITLNSNQKGTYRSSQSSTSSTIQVNSYSVVSKNTESSSIYSILILGVLLCLFLKR